MTENNALDATRRDALLLGAAGLLALAPFETPAFAMTGEMAGLPWANNAMRWAQVAFTEEDPPSYDPNFWFDLFKKTHVEAVSVGGRLHLFLPFQSAAALSCQISRQSRHVRRDGERRARPEYERDRPHRSPC